MARLFSTSSANLIKRWQKSRSMLLQPQPTSDTVVLWIAASTIRTGRRMGYRTRWDCRKFKPMPGLSRQDGRPVSEDTARMAVHKDTGGLYGESPACRETGLPSK